MLGHIEILRDGEVIAQGTAQECAAALLQMIKNTTNSKRRKDWPVKRDKGKQ